MLRPARLDTGCGHDCRKALERMVEQDAEHLARLGYWVETYVNPTLFSIGSDPKKFYAQNQKLSFSALTDSVDTLRLKPAIDAHVNKRIA